MRKSSLDANVRTRKLVAFGCGALACLALGELSLFYCFWQLRPSHNITQRSLNQITHGMKLEDVESLLGVPPGDYRTREKLGQDIEEKLPWILDVLNAKVWHADDISIYVEFDRHTLLVTRADGHNTVQPDVGFFHLLVRSLSP